jgi:hypothetical protein
MCPVWPIAHEEDEEDKEEDNKSVNNDLPNPLWGWIAFTKGHSLNFVSETHSPHPNNLEGLFCLLMRCECNTATVLNSTNKQGTSLLAYAMANTSFTPAKLLLRQPQMSLSRQLVAFHARTDAGIICKCAFCVGVDNRCFATDNDGTMIRMIARLTVEDSMRLIFYPHMFLIRCANKFRTFCHLFHLLSNYGTQEQKNKCIRSQLVIGVINEQYVKWNVLTRLLSEPDVANIYWNLLTATEMGLQWMYELMMENNNAWVERSVISPLAAVLYKPLNTVKDKDRVDKRAAWIVSRCSVTQLNHYDCYGETPLIRAAKFGLLMTLEALLRRHAEIDFDLRAISSNELKVDTYVHENPFTQKNTVYYEDNVLDIFRAWNVNHKMTNVESELEQLCNWYENELPPLKANVVNAILGAVNFPHEIVSITFQYANLPVPIRMQKDIEINETASMEAVYDCCDKEEEVNDKKEEKVEDTEVDLKKHDFSDDLEIEEIVHDCKTIDMKDVKEERVVKDENKGKDVKDVNDDFTKDSALEESTSSSSDESSDGSDSSEDSETPLTRMTKRKQMSSTAEPEWNRCVRKRN